MFGRYLRLSLLLLAPVAFAQTTWTRFEDPVEHAFTVDVPSDWTATGALFRLGYSDARPMIELKSPDGKTSIRLGDVAVPAYFIPNQAHRFEGEVYDSGAQAQMTVAQYRTGQEYAVRCAQARFQSLCQNLSPAETPAGPPPERALQPRQASHGSRARNTGANEGSSVGERGSTLDSGGSCCAERFSA